MNDQYVRNVIEAALLAAGRPLTLDELTSVFDERDGSNGDEVRAAIAALRNDYETRGLELVEVASGYRIQIKAAVAQPVARLWQERPAKYSRALLETLALVAYRQPITRGEIEQIRGVAVNPNIIKTLHERNWIRVVGHRDVPGKPELLGTTREFLDYFNLKKLDDLPTLAQLKELEDLRVQLSLPGADPQLAATDADAAPDTTAPDSITAPDSRGNLDSGGNLDSRGNVDARGSSGPAGLDTAADFETADDEDEPSEQASPRPQGLVAGGAHDDTI